MATLPQIRGLLLEEAILYLLRASGYETVMVQHISSDPTLRCRPNSPTDIEVVGRGVSHQIDAIADYMIAQPFSNPQRLLVEAKYYREPVGVEVIRNAVGVLKDVSEFYHSSNRLTIPAKNRYHYQYAIFSVSGFTKAAQQYAYAHDVYLFALKHSSYMQPLLDVLDSLTPADFNVRSQQRIPVIPSELRNAVRTYIRTYIRDDRASTVLSSLLKDLPAMTKIVQFCQDCRRIETGLIAVIDRRFPIFLVPNEEMNYVLKKKSYSLPWIVRIRIEGNQWFLELVDRSSCHLSFDLPRELFLMYAENDLLSREAALRLKEERLPLMQAIYMSSYDGQSYAQLLTFKLDFDWLETIRAALRQRQ